LDSGRLLITMTQNIVDENGKLVSSRVFDEEFDTVLSATGRGADTAGLTLDKAGVNCTVKGSCLF
jgi:pyruvate/2-oxoglutarate dehydrogenase complex dihydrolipoamide dehydrogenase (E3) component